MPGGPGLLAEWPASQQEGQGDDREHDHDRREDQCQPESNQMRLANPCRSVSVRVLVPVHLATFPKRDEIIPSYAYRDDCACREKQRTYRHVDGNHWRVYVPC